MEPRRQRGWVGHGLIGAVCVLLVAMIGRLAYIHAELSPALKSWSHSRLYSEIPLPARRGAILDLRHRVLAGSHDRPSVYADPALVPDKREAAEQLARVLPLSAEQLLHKLEHPTSRRYVVLHRRAERLEAEGVASLNIIGVGLRDEPVRHYPMGKLAAHMLGFVGADEQGLEGVEWKCDRFLKGKAGRRVIFRDVSRRALFQEPGSYVAPEDGLHVVLTLDAAIQEVVEQAVAEQVEHHAAESGVGLVMDPQTGAVLALACVPTFDPSEPGAFDAAIRRNRVLTDPVEPGSIFKPFIMAAALAEGVTHPEEPIDCEGGLYFIGRRPLQDHHAMGLLTTTLILVRSSNIGMAKLGLRLGNDRMYHALRKFGFGGPTGIDLPGEGEGLLMPLRAWGSYTTSSVPMGHELAVTPIQVLTGFASIVNGGSLIEPYVIARIVQPGGQVIEDRSDVRERGRSLDAETAQTMKGILAQVVSHEQGTGRHCQLDQWQVMGKTGTAQVPRTDRRGYEPNAYLASFIAAAPVREPALAVLVMVHKPTKNGYYGSQVALPAVKKILEFALPYLNVPPEPPVGRSAAAQLVQATGD